MPALVELAHYEDKYASLRLERSADGVLLLTVHTQDGPFVMTGRAHGELADAFTNIAADGANRVLVMTGTGDEFCTGWDASTFSWTSAQDYAQVHYEGRRILQALLDVEVPVISAINGPSLVHVFPVVADICICTPDATFQDRHVIGGSPVGDGANLVWEHLLGPTRSKYFLLTGEVLDAQAALQAGVVNEIVPRKALLPRALELAGRLATLPPVTLRYTRLILNQRYRRLMEEDLAGTYALQALARATSAL